MHGKSQYGKRGGLQNINCKDFMCICLEHFNAEKSRFRLASFWKREKGYMDAKSDIWGTEEREKPRLLSSLPFHGCKHMFRKTPKQAIELHRGAGEYSCLFLFSMRGNCSMLCFSAINQQPNWEAKKVLLLIDLLALIQVTLIKTHTVFSAINALI